jgi:hypothetical protein
MTYSGYILNSVTEKPIPFASVILYENGNRIGGDSANADGFFSISTTTPAQAIVITSVNYQSASFPASIYQNRFELEPKDVTLPPVVVHDSHPKKNYTWAVAILALAVIANKEGKRSVNGVAKQKINRADIITAAMIVAGVMGFSIIKKLLVKLGIFEGEGQHSVEDENTNLNSPWKAAFYKAAPNGALLITTATADYLSSQVHNAFGIFEDDFNQIMAAFRQLKTQSQISFLADRFAIKYGEDLLTFLTNGGGILPWDGLNDKHLKQITDYVKALPKYRV